MPPLPSTLTEIQEFHATGTMQGAGRKVTKLAGGSRAHASDHSGPFLISVLGLDTVERLKKLFSGKRSKRWPRPFGSSFDWIGEVRAACSKWSKIAFRQDSSCFGALDVVCKRAIGDESSGLW